MLTLAPTTELEAVNTLLRAIGESPTSTLVDPSGVDVITAKATLESVSRQVQSSGWMFNTEYNYPLPVAADGTIPIPANALVVDVDTRRYSAVDPVVRGNKLYDRCGHTYTFDTSLEARIIFYLPFEDLPELARHYITIRAARIFQDDSVGSDGLHMFKLRDEINARARLLDEQAESADLNFILDDPQFNPYWS